MILKVVETKTKLIGKKITRSSPFGDKRFSIFQNLLGSNSIKPFDRDLKDGNSERRYRLEGRDSMGPEHFSFVELLSQARSENAPLLHVQRVTRSRILGTLDLSLGHLRTDDLMSLAA